MITDTGDALGDAIASAIASVDFAVPDVIANESAADFRARVEVAVAANRVLACRAIGVAVVDHLVENVEIVATAPDAGGTLLPVLMRWIS